MAFKHDVVPAAYDRSSARPDDTAVVFAEDQLVQATELNDMQGILKGGIGRAARLSARDGDRISGADLRVDSETGEVKLEAGSIFAAGDVRPVSEAKLTGVPMDGEAQIGVRVVKQIISPDDEPSLRGLHPGTEAEGENGAWREVARAAWGFAGDGEAGDLYTVYRLVDGVPIDTQPPVQLSTTLLPISTYDREANGNYIAEGCKVTAIGFEDTDLLLDIAAGSANIYGYKRRRETALRIKAPQVWETERIDGENHTFLDGDGNGRTTVQLRNAPLDSVVQALIEKRETVTVTRGGAAGGMDQLPQSSIVAVDRVWQGGTDYSDGSDYQLVGDRINWAAGGKEPTGGSTYKVTYRYRDAVTPVATTDDTVTLSGGLVGGEIILTYTRKMPRIDLVCLDKEGKAVILPGIPARAPVPPQTPATLLKLAEVHNSFSGLPEVVNNGTFARSYDDLEAMYQLLRRQTDLVALNRLQIDIAAREPAAKYGTFVDPFLDDQFRDEGAAQNAAVFDGIMTLAIDPTVHEINRGKVEMLPWVPEKVIDQPQATTCKKVNRFANATPLPAKMTIQPTEDFWTEERETWASSLTRRLTGRRNRTTTSTRVIDERSAAAQFVRPISIEVLIEGFGAGENLVYLGFDGVDMTPSDVAANDVGVVKVNLNIPGQTYTTGRKRIEARGQGGSSAEAVFVSEGTINTRVLQQVTTITRRPRRSDPRGQIWSWPLGQARHCAGAEVKFCKVGDKNVPCLAQLRRVNDAGYPTDEVIDEHEIDMSKVEVGEAYRIDFTSLPFITDVERTALIIVTSDQDHSISAAELGEFDATRQEFVTRQPYTVGTEVESSTGSTWAPIHESDLTFSILASKFTETFREIDLGEVNLVAASDLLLMAASDLPTGDTNVEFELRRSGKDSIKLVPEAPLELGEWLTDKATLVASLTGTETASPRLFPHVQLIAGTMKSKGSYVSRRFDVTGGDRLPVRIKQLLPSGSAVKVSVLLKNGNWHELPFKSGEVQEVGGWVDALYEDASLPTLGTQSAIKIEFEGTAAARPVFSDLRATVI